MTLKDVAHVSGCSVATVSKVFKNSAEISEDTKQRVIKAARQIGYLKKGYFKICSAWRSKTFGFLRFPFKVFGKCGCFQ